MIQKAKSKPINISDDIKPRVIPFFIKTLQEYGTDSFIWLGPKPSVIITDPELVKEVLTKIYIYQKPQNMNPLTKLLAQGVVSYEEDKWAKHRKIINPAFHLEKLKLMMPAFYLSCDEILGKWEQSLSPGGSCDLDREQAEHIIKASQSIYIPGLRFVPTERNKRMKFIEKQVQASFRDIIDRRVKAMKAGEANFDGLNHLRIVTMILYERSLEEILEHQHSSYRPCVFVEPNGAYFFPLHPVLEFAMLRNWRNQLISKKDPAFDPDAQTFPLALKFLEWNADCLVVGEYSNWNVVHQEAEIHHKEN
ncbi:unnamed protein product [Fraxinus pennsylvanica]|uniref:Cytochrome P450 n=1 Tax=Fraxinus pennsylvanica TaxID=56036 RepID=A0AAD1YVA9_9LAMI|nr:unnamed protein product [Fraxinus pennsylvanica]